MEEENILSASLEDYLEAIFHIVSEKQAARAKDIAMRLNVNNSSVTGALRALSEKGVINYAPYDVITLTPKGGDIAKDIVRRHEALRDFLVKILCIEETEADEAACKMEHAVSHKILDRIIQFMEFVAICPRGGVEWIKGFRHHCRGGGLSFASCENSISMCLEDLKKRKEQLEVEPLKTVLLKELNVGQKGKILKIKGRDGIKKKMTDMGIAPGNVIFVEQIDPSGEPIDIKVKGYHLSLRKQEAAKITVKLYR